MHLSGASLSETNPRSLFTRPKNQTLRLHQTPCCSTLLTRKSCLKTSTCKARTFEGFEVPQSLWRPPLQSTLQLEAPKETFSNLQPAAFAFCLNSSHSWSVNSSRPLLDYGPESSSGEQLKKGVTTPQSVLVLILYTPQHVGWRTTVPIYIQAGRPPHDSLHSQHNKYTD